MFSIYFITIYSFSSVVSVQTSAYSTNEGVCQETTTVFMSLQEVYQSKGLFVTVVPDEGIFRLLDNLCVTAFPLGDSPDYYTFYSTVVLIDGTAIQTYTLAEDIPPGTFKRANPDGTVSQRFFHKLDNNSTLACTQFDFGVNPSPPLFVTSFFPRPATAGEVAKIEEIFLAKGFQNVSLRALPMLLPTQCVMEEPCDPQGPCQGNCNIFHCAVAKALGLA